MYFFISESTACCTCGFAQFQHRIAIGFLVAGIGERIQRQGILIGRGDFLLDQTADDARFERQKIQCSCIFQLGAACI